jgi:hypothetical protein
MATTLLAKKADGSVPLAKTDDHHDAMAADPTISAFPAGSSFGSAPLGGNTMSTAPAAGGFGSFGSISPGAQGSLGNAPTINQGSSSVTSTNTNTLNVTQNQAESLKSGGGAMSEGGESTVKLDKDATDWINKKMRPMMGWIYMLTCTCDFVIFPVLWSILQAMSHGSVTSQWQPLTLQGAGLYHIAMGAVLGIAAYGRTKEKVAGVAS